MKYLRWKGATSNIFDVFIRDSTSTTGAGLTGLTFASAGLTAYHHQSNTGNPIAITLVTMTIGTYTSGGFKEIDSVNMPGWYQFCPPDSSLGGTANSNSTSFHLKGATNMVPLPFEVDIGGQVDIRAAGGNAITSSSGVMYVNASQLGGQAVTAASGVTFPATVASPTNVAAAILATPANLLATDASGRVLLQPTQTGVTIPTVTTLTNLPAITAGWLTATGIAAGALNGKGDWNTTTPATTAAIAAAILATPANLLATDVSGRVLLQPTQTGVTIPTVTTLTNLPAITAGWLTATGIATDAIGSAQLAASAVTEIQTGLATSTVQTSQGVQITWLQNFLGGDKSIDTAVTPWAEVVKIAGTGTELIRKKLRDVAGANITATTVVIGSAKDA